MTSEIRQLAEKYISDHNNPITKKLELFGSKLFLSPLTEDEECRKDKFFKDKEDYLKHNRVDRRVARGVAEWLPLQNQAKVTKIVGALANFGVQNKDGKFLNAEEALFLVEINKLELVCNDVPMGIEEAYKNIKCLKKYLAYKQLALHGCKLKTPVLKNSRQTEEVEEEDGPPTKVAKIDENVDQATEVLEKLRQNAPQTFQARDSLKKAADFDVNMPTCRENLENFNLIVCTSEDYTSNVDEDNLNVFALNSDGDVSFYKFYNTNIPIL
ncbi:hypothetical protein Zmor_022533 [Zophobas morio]|uniref:tRNA-splicing endonuclease subunit Sen54 N-terminal domain-containing protein n=1 Tax=Zophobas morio TaxID=2755281 RepID=A0AA38HXT0_9CUCU|nr:hypothetical protein Zmor_022533 [Zophobas morio]